MTVGCGDQSTRWTLTALSESGGGEGLERVEGLAQIIAPSSSVTPSHVHTQQHGHRPRGCGTRLCAITLVRFAPASLPSERVCLNSDVSLRAMFLVSHKRCSSLSERRRVLTECSPLVEGSVQPIRTWRQTVPEVTRHPSRTGKQRR